MPPTRKTHSAQKPSKSPETSVHTAPVGSRELDRLEFFRHGKALMPDPDDPYPAIAYDAKTGDGYMDYTFCSCTRSGRTTCAHLKALYRITHHFESLYAPNAAEAFKASVWHRMAAVLADGARDSVENITLMRNGQGKENALVMAGQAQEPLLFYLSQGEDRSRLISRCSLSTSDATVPSRADVLKQLTFMTMAENERVLSDRGLKSARQTFENSFWYRFAYQLFKEFGCQECRLHPAIDDLSGEFILNAKDGSDQVIFYLPVPRAKVKRLLVELKDAFTNQHGLNIQPLALDSVFDVRLNEGLDMEIQPMLRLIQQNGELRFFKREDLRKFQYGHLYYIKELGLLVEDNAPGSAARIAEPARTVIQRGQVPQFLSEHGLLLNGELYRLDEKLRRFEIMTSFDRIAIFPKAVEKSWCWLDVTYGDGNQSISLASILAAKKAGQRFVATRHGWVDCQSPPFAHADELVKHQPPETQGDQEGVPLPRFDLFRITALNECPVEIDRQSDQANQLKQMLALQPLKSPLKVMGLTSGLRGYQELGVQWLWFLFENGFGGLLCDDMGLGKTHQVMAFMVGLRETDQARHPFLVVCPTSVISHWERKIAEHAPGLKAVAYYGGQRDLAGSIAQSHVVITSYGVLRRDYKLLQARTFDLIVFDEIQVIKNAETQSYKAAQELSAGMKIGLTGTPIENRIDELKTLMDVVVPGYLGSDKYFAGRYRIPIEKDGDVSRKRQLSRLVSPFTLRRLKKTVLKDLPPKIEDSRTCRLSEDQIKLYRDAIDRRGRELRLALSQENLPVPYIHIFALLNLLKQICNHPALVEKRVKGYRDYASGKWDLFVELLEESLDSGQKIVVYSQFLGMIEIIGQYLTDLKIGFVALTGASRGRGAIIERFEKDPECRVFVGSLKAGGVGIDLVSASVVIHYDRWWNAAREDQATDRVHRIGQRRGVQVFKLITEGTLEEKIAAIIEKKRHLMDSIVEEDDPTLLKSFTRPELLDLIAPL